MTQLAYHKRIAREEELKKQVTRWLDPEKYIRTEYGHITGLDWLKSEAQRLAKGRVIEYYIKKKKNGRVALFIK